MENLDCGGRRRSAIVAHSAAPPEQKNVIADADDLCRI
jgi:hypothetical protein